MVNISTTNYGAYRSNDYSVVSSAWAAAPAHVHTSTAVSIYDARADILQLIESKQIDPALISKVKQFYEPLKSVSFPATTVPKGLNTDELKYAFYLLNKLTSKSEVATDLADTTYGSISTEGKASFRAFEQRRKAIEDAIKTLNDSEATTTNQDDVQFIEKLINVMQTTPDIPNSGYGNTDIVGLLKALYDFYIEQANKSLGSSGFDNLTQAWDATAQAAKVLSICPKAITINGKELSLREEILDQTTAAAPAGQKERNTDTLATNISTKISGLLNLSESATTQEKINYWTNMATLLASGKSFIKYITDNPVTSPTGSTTVLVNNQLVLNKITDSARIIQNSALANTDLINTGIWAYLNNDDHPLPTTIAGVEAILTVLSKITDGKTVDLYNLILAKPAIPSTTGITDSTLTAWINNTTKRAYIEGQYKALTGNSDAAKKTILQLYTEILNKKETDLRAAADAAKLQERKSALTDALRSADSIRKLADLLQNPENKDLLSDTTVVRAAMDRATSELAKAATQDDLNRFIQKIPDDAEVNAESTRRQKLLEALKAVLNNTDRPADATLKQSATQDQLQAAALAARDLQATPDNALGNRYLALLKIKYYTTLAEYRALGDKHDSAYLNTNTPRESDPPTGIIYKARTASNAEDGRDISSQTREHDYYPTRQAKASDLETLSALIKVMESGFTNTAPALEAIPTALTTIIATYWDANTKRTKGLASIADQTTIKQILSTLEQNAEYIVTNKDAILAIYDELKTQFEVVANRERAFTLDNKVRRETDPLTTLSAYAPDAKAAIAELIKAKDAESIKKLQAELDALMTEYANLTRTWSDTPAMTTLATPDTGSNGLETKGGIKEHLYYVARKDIRDDIMDLRTLLTPANLGTRPEPAALIDQADQTTAIQTLLATYFNAATNNVNTSALSTLTSIAQVQAILDTLDKGLEFIGYAGIMGSTKVNPEENLRRAQAIYTAAVTQKGKLELDAEKTRLANETILKAMLDTSTTKVDLAKVTADDLTKAEAARTLLPADNAIRLAYEKALLETYVTQLSKYNGIISLQPNYDANAVPLTPTKDAIAPSEENKPAQYKPYTLAISGLTWNFIEGATITTSPIKEATEYGTTVITLEATLALLKPNADAILAAHAGLRIPLTQATRPATFGQGQITLTALKTKPTITTLADANTVIRDFQENAEFLSLLTVAADRSTIIRKYAEALSFKEAYDRIKPSLDVIMASATNTSDEDLKTLTALLTQAVSKADLQKIKDDPTLQKSLVDATINAIKDASALALTPQRAALEALKAALERAKADKTISNADALIALVNDQLRDSTRNIINAEYDRLSSKLKAETDNKATLLNLDRAKAELIALTNDSSKDLPGYDKVIADLNKAYALDLENYEKLRSGRVPDTAGVKVVEQQLGNY